MLRYIRGSSRARPVSEPRQDIFALDGRLTRIKAAVLRGVCGETFNQTLCHLKGYSEFFLDDGTCVHCPAEGARVNFAKATIPRRDFFSSCVSLGNTSLVEGRLCLPVSYLLQISNGFSVPYEKNSLLRCQLRSLVPSLLPSLKGGWLGHLIGKSC